MSARSKARKRALDVLYEADLRSAPINEVLTSSVARIEDTLVVGEGAPELLTTTSKDLLAL